MGVVRVVKNIFILDEVRPGDELFFWGVKAPADEDELSRIESRGR